MEPCGPHADVIFVYIFSQPVFGSNLSLHKYWPNHVGTKQRVANNNNQWPKAKSWRTTIRVKLKVDQSQSHIPRSIKNWTFLVKQCPIFLNDLNYVKIKKIFHISDALENPLVLVIDILSMQLKQTPIRRWKNYAIRQILIFLFKQFDDDSTKQASENGVLNNESFWPRNRLHNDMNGQKIVDTCLIIISLLYYSRTSR